MTIIAPLKDDIEVLNSEIPIGANESGLNVDAAEANGVTDTPTAGFKLEERTIDDARPLRVAVVGAGIGGINAGILLPVKVPGIQLTIFDKNSDVGGTWLENVYPGVRCDIPANVYQSTFAPNTQWSEVFAQGKEIEDYWRDVAKKFNVYRYIKFGHQVTGLEWDDAAGEWTIQLHTKEGDKQEAFDFVVLSVGLFNEWKLPDYPGIHEYQGHLRHTSNWDPTYDPKGKRVAVIGNGASGIQVVPNLQRVAAHIDHYARNKTWVAGSWTEDARTFEPQYFSAKQLKDFEDPEIYLQYRKKEEEKYWRGVGAILPNSKENEDIRNTSLKILKERLLKKPELLDKLVPDFSPHCRRLTPGPGYLEALDADNVDYIQTPIKRFTQTGIETADGVHREVDAVFCATGFNNKLIPQFPIVANGIDLRSAWAPGGKWGFPYTYFGLATPGFPNLLWMGGAHGGAATGTVPYLSESLLTYYAQLLRKVSSQGIRSIQPSVGAVEDFLEYARAFFKQTVYSEKCSSWANGGQPGAFIHSFWPGSGSHLALVRAAPRWEDWEYTYHSKSGKRYAYFGPGWTKKELDPDADLAGYLKLPSQVDLRSLHEQWWEKL
ncbi:hypothetical protein M426DRAFT_23798 [Hypoxylon sp. CI-4A]|nr:hypothetical protein M426DRAFT_23798 [Hypoxylon sp. CI-4A]